MAVWHAPWGAVQAVHGCAALAALALHGAILFALLAPLTRVRSRDDPQAAVLPLIASVLIAPAEASAAGVPAPILPELPAPARAITLPRLPPLATEALVADAFEAARAAQSAAEAAQFERLQGVYLGQIRGRLARVLEMAAPALPERGPCAVQVIQNERGDVLDVDTSACTGSAARRTRLAQAMQRASPLPPPPAGLAPGSSLTLDLSQY
ncbi:MAG: hypothetical protein AB7P31_07490 [Steroidobacteraceae bacterium]